MAEQAMMTAVRIKRKADENPSGAIVLATKRARTSHENESGENFAFEYAGTVSTPSDVDAAIQQIKEAKRRRMSPKVHSMDIHSKLRDEHRSSSKENRLQLLLKHRSILEVCSEEVTDENLEAPRESTHSLFQLYDVFAEDNEKDDDSKENEDPEKKKSEIACNNVPMVREAAREEEVDESYVYDIYYNDVHCNFIGEDEFRLFRCGPPDAFAPEHDFAYDSDPGLDTGDGEDTDSNAEDNWRNDYPDDEDTDILKQFDMYAGHFEDTSTSSLRNRLNGLSLVFSDDDEPAQDD
ncbi:female sterile (2) ltoPP43 isoform X1 [Dermacentor variabilis]|uniref:female sterile (2) ltoPP43 isoform X1 n=2 Tax=Dermacentor variabilis TaxID=34621 RepID=UPI003F5B5BF9